MQKSIILEIRDICTKTPTVSWFIKRGKGSIININSEFGFNCDGKDTYDYKFITSSDFTLEGPFATKEIFQLVNLVH